MDKLLYEQSDKYKCFLEDNEVCFMLNIDGDTLSYTLSGHPYTPTFVAKCNNEAYSYSEEGGLWFPDVDSDWSGFCKDLAVKLIVTYMLKAFPNMLASFQMTYKQQPNTQGIFKKQDNWYVYQTDERNNVDISGPFDEDEIIYAVALLLHVSDHFKEHAFSEDAQNRYIHSHFRSIKEIGKNTMTFDEKILVYEMGAKDIQLANIAQLIVGAYNGERKPHIIPKEKEVAPPYYRWKHSPEGYSLLTSETDDFNLPTVLVTDEHINDFVEHVFLVLAGNTDVKWNKVYTSNAVKHALDKHFGMKVDLSNIGPDGCILDGLKADNKGGSHL